MLHQQLINFHYHVRFKGLDPRDVFHAAMTSLLILLNKTLCRCSVFTGHQGRILKYYGEESFKNATQESRNGNVT